MQAISHLDSEDARDKMEKFTYYVLSGIALDSEMLDILFDPLILSTAVILGVDPSLRYVLEAFITSSGRRVLI